MCFTNFINIDRSVSSNSGLYAVDLPGIVLSTFEDLTTEDQASYNAFWSVIYNRAISNFISDVSNALQSKFHVDSKLLARETSQFVAALNNNSGPAGVLIEMTLPRYAKLHVLTIDMFLEKSTPAITLNIRDTDINGQVLYSEIINPDFDVPFTVPVHLDFDVETIFAYITPSAVAADNVRGTENKVYNTYDYYTKDDCSGCYGEGLHRARVQQVNGGGLNIKYVIFCSVEKFVCENLNLFKKALWWKIGEELAVEMIFGERINRFTTMSSEGADKRMAFFTAQFQKELNEAIKSHNIPEDMVCFRCKNVVESIKSLP